MKLVCVSIMVLLAAGTPLRAGTVENAIMAAMSLTEKPNYSWRCTITDDAQTYDIDGKTVEGVTWQQQPMPRTIARRLGRGAGDFLESIFTGPQTYVIGTENGWRMLDELPKQHEDWNDFNYMIAVPVMPTPSIENGATDIWGMNSALPPPVVYYPIYNDPEDDPNQPHSNAQFAISLPHEELAVIVSAYASLEASDDMAMGRLTDVGARLLLVRDGHEYIQPVVADGRFKLWMKNGLVSKYLIELAGIVIVDKKTIYVRQRSLTALNNLGRTQIFVPQDAWRRLVHAN